MPDLMLCQGTAQRLPLCDNSINTIITSPPYYGLRSYNGLAPEAWRGGTFVAMPGAVPIIIPGPETWEGLETCTHVWSGEGTKTPALRNGQGASTLEGGKGPALATLPTGAWCQQCGCWKGTLGSEPTVDLFIFHLVLVLRELYRVLHSTGTLWLNLGDSYSASGKSGGGKQGAAWDDYGQQHVGDRGGHWHATEGIAQGNLLGIPWRVALAAQAEGWILRRDVVWEKVSPMPESVRGWAHEQKRCACLVPNCVYSVQQKAQENGHREHPNGGFTQAFPATVANPTCDACHGTRRRIQSDCQLCHGTGAVFPATLRDVPMDGATFRATCDQYPCEACAGTGKIDADLTLRRGSWRHTASHEYIFMLVKRMGYFANSEGVREENQDRAFASRVTHSNFEWAKHAQSNGGSKPNLWMNEVVSGRNPRSVIRPAPSPYAGAHFATFPVSLPEQFLRVSCPERVCSACGAPWAPMIHTQPLLDGHIPVTEAFASPDQPRRAPANGISHMRYSTTHASFGLARTCACPDDTAWHPGICLDPFGGTGTVGLVARTLGRHSVLIEASPAYLQLSRKRLGLTDLDAWQGKPAAPHVETYTDLPLFA